MSFHKQNTRKAEEEEGCEDDAFESGMLDFFIGATNAVWESDEMMSVIVGIVRRLRVDALNTNYYSRPIQGDPIISDLFCENPHIVATLCKKMAASGINHHDWMAAGAFYAGITGVTYWQVNSDLTKQIGVTELTTSSFVLNRVVQHTSDLRNLNSEDHQMAVELQKLCCVALSIAKEEFKNIPYDKAEILTIVTAMLAMSFFGMQLKMYDIGMR